MRKLKTHYIGRLVSFAGTVTRTSEVRPELFSATFKCMACGTLKRNVPQQFRYTEPLVCDAPTCGNTYVGGGWMDVDDGGGACTVACVGAFAAHEQPTCTANVPKLPGDTKYLMIPNI